MQGNVWSKLDVSSGRTNAGQPPQYEIDSLCGFLKLSRAYYQSTGDSSFINEHCGSRKWPFLSFSADHCVGKAAVDQIFRVVNEQSQPSFDEEFNFISYYNWTGSRGSLSPRVNNRGNNEPRAYTGLVATSHRPSDDLTVYGE
jgi:meiotically up-regulated gene 157 (Mug157) protein